MYFDAGSTPSLDGYSRYIDAEKARIGEKEATVRGELATNLSDAEARQDSTYTAYKFATVVFNTSNAEMNSYQRRIQELQEEMKLAIKMATEEAQAQGKSQQEIDNICANITGQYSDKIAGIEWTISQHSGVNQANRNNSNIAKNNYSDARYYNISASNAYIYGLFSLAQDYHHLGKMQQHFNFLNAQSEGGWLG